MNEEKPLFNFVRHTFLLQPDGSWYCAETGEIRTAEEHSKIDFTTAEQLEAAKQRMANLKESDWVPFSP